LLAQAGRCRLRAQRNRSIVTAYES
jgi:hypothetical protein